MMNKEFVQKIQNKVLEFAQGKTNVPPTILLEDCCSELSRLVASWIWEHDQSCHFLILKGDNVCGTLKSHDILAVINQNQEVDIIDPTIWQFFPGKTSILVFVSQSINEALEKITKLYGGKWLISEKLSQISSEDQTAYKAIILKNIEENLKIRKK